MGYDATPSVSTWWKHASYDMEGGRLFYSCLIRALLSAAAGEAGDRFTLCHRLFSGMPRGATPSMVPEHMLNEGLLFENFEPGTPEFLDEFHTRREMHAKYSNGGAPARVNLYRRGVVLRPDQVPQHRRPSSKRALPFCLAL